MKYFILTFPVLFLCFSVAQGQWGWANTLPMLKSDIFRYKPYFKGGAFSNQPDSPERGTDYVYQDEINAAGVDDFKTSLDEDLHEEFSNESLSFDMESETKPVGLEGKARAAFKPVDSFQAALNSIPAPLKDIVMAYQTNFQEHLVYASNVSKVLLSDMQDCSTAAECPSATEGQYLECIVDCLTKSKPKLNKFSKLISQTVQNLCNPLGTIFESVFTEFEKESRFENFLAKLNLQNKDLTSASIVGSQAVFNYALQNAQTALTPIGALLENMKAKKPPPEELSTTISEGQNPLCTDSFLVDYAKKLIALFNKDPSLQDMMLPGFMTVSTLVKYVPGEHQQYLSGFMDIFEIITETTCGVVHSGLEVKPPAYCDQLGAFPRSGTILPRSILPIKGWQKFCEQPKEDEDAAK